MNWSEVLAKFPEANFLQSPEYGEMNSRLGCRVRTFDFQGRGWALGIVRDAKRGRYLEMPCGPLIDWRDAGLVREAIPEIFAAAREEKCVFVRMRPQLLATEENLKILEGAGLKKSPMHLAAEHTVMIDLNLSEEELLSKMRRQTRYEVRRAGKLGISVSVSREEAAFREFYEVQGQTAKRQGFVPPSLEVLMAEREAFRENIAIYKAEISAEKLPEAGIIAPPEVPQTEVNSDSNSGAYAIAYGMIIRGGREADYYEAASTELHRKLPGAYALLWQAILDAKRDGYERFNLWGIAPAGQPNHRYAGVTTFKTGFPGEVVEFVPAHDLVVSKGRYLADFAFETLRKKRRHL